MAWLGWTAGGAAATGFCGITGVVGGPASGATGLTGPGFGGAIGPPGDAAGPGPPGVRSPGGGRSPGPGRAAAVALPGERLAVVWMLLPAAGISLSPSFLLPARSWTATFTTTGPAVPVGNSTPLRWPGGR